MKIVIVVSGGLVAEIYSDKRLVNTQVIVADYDNTEDGKDSDGIVRSCETWHVISNKERVDGIINWQG